MAILQRARLLPALVTASLAVVAAGCGSTAPRTDSTQASDGNMVAKAFQYSQCMREHGVPGFPDPKVRSQPGSTQIAMAVSKQLVASPQAKAAAKACQGIMPEPSQAEIAQQQRHELQGKLAFAHCMRTRGVTSFPDPNTQGNLSPTMLSSAGVDIHAPAVIADAKACASSSDGVITAAQIDRATGGGG